MAYLLYRNGNKHVIWGKPCEYKQFADEDVDQALQDGWVLHPKDLAEEKEVTEVQSVIEEAALEEAAFEEAAFEEFDTSDIRKLSSEEVRQAAKAKNVEGWETKRIKTLKKELRI